MLSLCCGKKTFVFVDGGRLKYSPRDLPPENHEFEKKLLDLLGVKLLAGHIIQGSNIEYPNVDKTGNEVSLEDINSLLSDNSTDITHKIAVVQNVKAYLIALKETLDRQKLAKSRNKEQTELLTITETNFNTGKVIDLSRIDLDYETDQLAATTFPISSENYTFEETSEIEKTSETLINSSFYNDMNISSTLLVEEGNLTPDINTKEFRVIGTTEPSFNTSSNINEFSKENTKLTNNTPTEIPVVEKTAGIILRRTENYKTTIAPTTVKIQLPEPEVKSLSNSKTSDRFTVPTIPKVISSTEKILIRPDPTIVSSNVISFQNTSTKHYSTTFSSVGQTNDFSSVDKFKYSENKIFGTVLEERKNEVKYTTFDAHGCNSLFNSIVTKVFQNIFSDVLRNNNSLLEEIRGTDKKHFVGEMEKHLPLEYLEVYEDILDLFRLNILLVFHKQSNDSMFFYRNRDNYTLP